jgi:hypothetical protein
MWKEGEVMADLKEPEDDRVEIPLVMLRGNMDCLLNNIVPVNGISLRWSKDHVNAVILVVHGIDHEVAVKLGFKTKHE